MRSQRKGGYAYHRGVSVLPRNEEEARSRLKAVEAEMARLEEEIRRLYPGVRVKWVRCGKRNCWCAGAKGVGKGHGPYYYRYRWLPGNPEEKGRQRETYLGKDLGEALPAGWRELKRLGKRLSALQAEREEILLFLHNMR